MNIKTITDPKKMQERHDIAKILKTYLKKLDIKEYISFLPKKCKKEGYFYITLDDDKGKCLSFAGLRIQYGTKENIKFLDMQYFVTDPKHTKKGYGTELIRFINNYANENDFVSFNLTISDESTAKNLKTFYSSTGFLLSGLRMSKNIKYTLKTDQTKKSALLTQKKQLELLKNKKQAIDETIKKLEEC